nr:uncharacterized protein LOC112034241 [Quercus suber]
MEGNFDAMALDTFKLGLPTDHDLRTSFSGKPVTSMRQLMDRIEKYKRVEEDQQQGKGKEKIIPQERRDFKSDRFSGSKPRRDFSATGSTNPQTVNIVFKELVHQILEKITGEPFFRWPNKMVGNPERRNHNLFCQYHQDHGHTTEDCRSLWDHLDQLVRDGKLKHLLHHSSGRESQASSESRRNDPSKPPLGTINVVFATPGRIGSLPSKVMSIARSSTMDPYQDPKRAKNWGIRREEGDGGLRQCRGDNVPRSLQGARPKTSGLNAIQLSPREFRRKSCHPERPDTPTCANRF